MKTIITGIFLIFTLSPSFGQTITVSSDAPVCDAIGIGELVDGTYTKTGTDISGRNIYASTWYTIEWTGTQWGINAGGNGYVYTNNSTATPNPPATGWSVGLNPGNDVSCSGSPAVELSGAVSVLPVELMLFEAKASNDKVSLYWQTASELNNEKFEVEESADGREFQKIGEVKGNGTTLEQQDYLYEVKNPRNGVAYYRLKQTDFDGKFEYSEIINVVFVSADDKSVAIYPNPVQDELTISEGVGNITIYNALGQPVKQIINESETTFAIDVRDLPQGVYSLQLRKANGEVVTTQFVK